MTSVFTCLIIALTGTGDITPGSFPHFHNNRFTTVSPGFTDSLLLNGVSFSFDKVEITKESFIHLDSLADVLIKNTGMKIEIEVHSDIRGNDKYNLLLSEKRADGLKGYLVKKGIHESRLIAIGKGETELLFSDWYKDKQTDPENSAPSNERIEIKFTCDTLPEHFYQLDSVGVKNGYWADRKKVNQEKYIEKGLYKNGKRFGQWQRTTMTGPEKNKTEFIDYRQDTLTKFSNQEYVGYVSYFYDKSRCTGKENIKDGYNKLYDDEKRLVADGEFKCNMIWNGKIYIYTAGSFLVKICIVKGGKYVGNGQIE